VISIDLILCPVDLSEPSRAALEHATHLARSYDARLSVLAVAGLTDPPLSDSPPVLKGLSLEARARILDAVSAFAEPARAAGVVIDVKLEEGDIVREIVREAESSAPDLVVMGTHGRGGFERFVLGSVVDKVIRKLPSPLLTVPPGARRTPAETAGYKAGYKTVLAAMDFSEASRHALTYALSFAQEAAGRLLLTHVVEWPAESQVLPPYDRLRAEMVQAAEGRLREAVPDEARNWCEPEIVVSTGDAARGIVHLASEEQAEIIVLGVTGRSALDRALNGTTAYQVIRMAPCPVLTVRL
jgi:nucleotide-binding universal stress UspA family protein